VELRVIGSGAAYPVTPGRASSAYVLLHEASSICLDLGQGAFAGLAGRTDIEGLLAVVVSHLHPDHFVDLVPLRHYLRFEFEAPRRIRVVAPAGLEARLDGLAGERGFAASALDIEDRVEGVLGIGPFVVESRRVTHTADSHATRVTLRDEPGRPGLVYSGDCGRAEDLSTLIRPGDTLLVEVAWGPGPAAVPDMHLDAGAIALLAAETRPRTVLLTHLQANRDPAATLDRVRAGWEGEVALVVDGDLHVV
jgi:ribonuclease BN (tRNA processing enzyme)